jgi:hypothetical protein
LRGLPPNWKGSANRNLVIVAFPTVDYLILVGRDVWRQDWPVVISVENKIDFPIISDAIKGNVS